MPGILQTYRPTGAPIAGTCVRGIRGKCNSEQVRINNNAHTCYVGVQDMVYPRVSLRETLPMIFLKKDIITRKGSQFLRKYNDLSSFA